MFANKFQIRLPRRVAAFFLLFGLASVVWLGIGAIYVAISVNRERSESAPLSRIGRAASRFELNYIQHELKHLQQLVEETCTESGAAYCGVVSLDGQFVAHSSRALTGKIAPEHNGLIDRWGDVMRVRYGDPRGVIYSEYQVPLTAGGEPFGSLRLGVAELSKWRLFQSVAEFAPFAFIGPVFLIAAGAVLVNRMVRPVAEIEQQLSRAAVSPSLESCDFSEVPMVGAAAAGWNRIITNRLNDSQREALRQRVKESLQTGRQSQLDLALNSISDGIATTDREGRLTYTNVPMAALLGMKDVIGCGGENSLSADRAPLMVDRLAEQGELIDITALSSDENMNRPVITELVREEEGEKRILRVSRHPIIVGGTSQAVHAWTMRDITQQKLAEEMRNQFVDTATHELRTPLANIKAYAETLTLADMIDVEQQKQFLNTINSEATRLARFVDDLLSVSSMEVGSLTLNKQVTDLMRMLNEVISKVAPQVEEKKLEFETTLPQKLPEPSIDKDKVATVLVNLLGNAVKYTPAGGSVGFRVNVTDQNLEISIEDTGVGIAEDELSRVFEKFFRSTDPRVQEETGTGLGLALAQEVIRLHGGQITVESEINKGSTFQVILPLG